MSVLSIRTQMTLSGRIRIVNISVLSPALLAFVCSSILYYMTKQLLVHPFYFL